MYSLNLKIFVKNNFIPDKIYSDEEIIELKEKANNIIEKINNFQLSSSTNNTNEYWNFQDELKNIRNISCIITCIKTCTRCKIRIIC